MSEHALKEINFARYQRWLDRAAGGETAFMVFNSKGQALWGSTFPQAEQLGQLILSSNPNEPGMQHQDVGTDKTALFQPWASPTKVTCWVMSLSWSIVLKKTTRLSSSMNLLNP